MDIAKIRRRYPVIKKSIYGKRIIYFDSACTVLKPQAVIDEISSFYRNLGTCSGNRSAHLLSWQTQELLEDSRFRVKEFINAHSVNEVIWTKNSTEGINLVANSFLPASGRNEVVFTTLEHHSAILPFVEKAKSKSLKVRIVPSNFDGTLNLNLLAKEINQKTALVVATHLSNVTGFVYPVKEIADLAHRKGAKILVDDAQYISTHKEDVRKNNIDFMVFSGHKIGAPFGVGVLYVKESLLMALLPYVVGGGTVKSVLFNGAKLEAAYLPPPSGFEAGVLDYASIIGLRRAIDFLEGFGYKGLQSYVESLTGYAVERLKEFKHINFVADYSIHKPVSLVSFYFNEKKRSLRDFNLFLNHGIKKYVILVRCGHHCCSPLHNIIGSPESMRLSFFMYNSREEIDVFCAALSDFLR